MHNVVQNVLSALERHNKIFWILREENKLSGSKEGRVQEKYFRKKITFKLQIKIWLPSAI